MANSENLKRIDSEIKEMKNRIIATPNPREEDMDEGKEAEERNLAIKKCRYFNRGYCKYKSRCKYFHPQQICQDHLETLDCELKGCKNRHPKVWKWFRKAGGCNREENLEFLHVTSACDEINAHKEIAYKCKSCRSIIKSENYVIRHIIQNFCLNCDDWVQNKELVLKCEWTLFDENGDLRRDV